MLKDKVYNFRHRELSSASGLPQRTGCTGVENEQSAFLLF